MPAPVIVVDYDPNWPKLFRPLHNKISAALGTLAITIEHVGSTGVPNLAAKPIIDIDVLLATETGLPLAIDRLRPLGYIHQGDLGIPGREAFLTPPHDVPHNLYVCRLGSREFHRHLAFRDYLRTHPHEAKEYGDLKKALAIKFRNDRDAYVAGKTSFVTEILDRAMARSKNPVT